MNHSLDRNKCHLHSFVNFITINKNQLCGGSLTSGGGIIIFLYTAFFYDSTKIVNKNLMINFILMTIMAQFRDVCGKMEMDSIS